jgi:hypothetical protein
MAKPPKTPQQRREESLARARGVGVPQNLPLQESEADAGTRTDDELRAQVLAGVLYWLRAVYASRAIPHAEFVRAMTPVRDAAEHALGEARTLFIDDPNPEADAIANAAWAIEAIAALLWAAGLVPDLPWPDQPCDPAALEPQVERVLGGAALKRRPTPELLDQADLHFVLLAAVVRAKVPGVDGSVVYERARALGWLIQPDVDWDDVDMIT